MGQQALVALGFLAWTVGCAKGPTQAGLDQAFRLEPGQTVTVRPEGLQVTFEGVEADSRCPMDVTCVWEGDATVKVAMAQPPRARESRELHTAGSLSRRVTYGDFELELQELQPQPRSTTPVSPADYRLRLVVRRAP
jgi:hypothetical protein